MQNLIFWFRNLIMKLCDHLAAVEKNYMLPSKINCCNYTWTTFWTIWLITLANKKKTEIYWNKIEYENDQKSLPVNIIESMGPLYSGIY